MKNLFCCPHCFENKYISDYINDNYETIGNCPYCYSESMPLISVRELGIYMRECIEKAYDGCDDGTGAMYISEDKIFIGPNGKEATIYSIREIMNDVEMIFSENTIESTLLDDLFENLYSVREIQKGADDPFDDVDSQKWVVKNDLYGCEQTEVFHAWESFKHIIKHYNRFFDANGFEQREMYLERLNSYIYNYDLTLPVGTKFFRARRIDDSLCSIDNIDPYKEMGPPPAEKATTNRMSPAGIPYLYLATDIETALEECRIELGNEAIIAEFVSKEELQILDLSTDKIFVPCSIFDPDYDHDDMWVNDFWKSFIREISQPVSHDKEDRSYEYSATQLIAEYYKIIGFDGICFKSSVGTGNNYVFFMGPDPSHSPNAYPYPFNSEYYLENLPIMRAFTEVFQIEKISRLDGNRIVVDEKAL